MQEPFYELEIKTSGCFIEIMINNLPIFSNYELGGMAVDYPINTAILKSGTQEIEIKILPTEENQMIIQQATVDIQIFVKEANKEASGKMLVKKIDTINFKDKNLPYYKSNTLFIANIPYENQGWTKSIDLKTIDEKLLIREFEVNLNTILSIYNSRKNTEYELFFKERITEYNRSFYLNPNEVEENRETIFYGLPDKIESVSFDKYRLVFYGNGKLVSLQTKHQPPGFVFESTNKDEYGFTEMVLFHKKSNNSPLEAIR